MLAKRLDHLGFSEIRKVYEKVNAMQGSGKQIFNLLLGEPDFPTPEPITETAIDSLRNGDTHYTSNFGLAELRRILADKFITENNIQASADEILITSGASEAIFLSMMAVINEGDDVLIPCPTWMNYASACRLAGGNPVLVPLHGSNSEFSLDLEVLKQSMTPRTRMLVLTNPGNPTGVTYNREALMAISELAMKHDWIVLADEIYEKIVFDHWEHVSIASLPGMKDRTITVNGFSKAYAMTGWRVGYLHASEQIMKGLVLVHQNNVTCLPVFSQKAAITALLEANEDVIGMREQLKRRRDLVVRLLNQSEYFDVRPPKGAIYIFLDIKKTGKSSNEFSSGLLEESGVAVVPGTAFGPFGEGYVRLSIAASEEVLQEACQRIAAYAVQSSLP